MRRTNNSGIIYRLLILASVILFYQGGLNAQDQIVTLPNGQKVVLHADKTWNYYKGITYDFDFSTLANNEIPHFLRQGITVDKQTLKVAVELYLQGWKYTMPSPKSSQASWGNHDGRTTWWKGYWYNNKTQKYSQQTPQKQSNGYYYGDKQNDKGQWSKGGSPGYPSKIDWLLSTMGGVKP